MWATGVLFKKTLKLEKTIRRFWTIFRPNPTQRRVLNFEKISNEQTNEQMNEQKFFPNIYQTKRGSDGVPPWGRRSGAPLPPFQISSPSLFKMHLSLHSSLPSSPLLEGSPWALAFRRAGPRGRRMARDRGFENRWNFDRFLKSIFGRFGVVLGPHLGVIFGHVGRQVGPSRLLKHHFLQKVDFQKNERHPAWE